jgi:nitrous oxide reductase accessory protein NosL
MLAPLDLAFPDGRKAAQIEATFAGRIAGSDEFSSSMLMEESGDRKEREKAGYALFRRYCHGFAP